jgi:hypothetical protein
MYMRNTIKRLGDQMSKLGGEAPRWKYTFSIDDKGGEIYHMKRIEA